MQNILWVWEAERVASHQNIIYDFFEAHTNICIQREYT